MKISEKETDIAEKVNMIFEDKAKAKQMGNNARKVVEEKFTWQTIAEKFVDVYEQSIATNGSEKQKKKSKKK